MKTTNSKVILAHDAFTQYGGAERVFEAAQEMFTDAPIYTLAVDKSYNGRIKGWNIVTSPLQYLYDIHPKLTHLFVFIPLVFKVWRPKRAKVLLSFSSSFIKGLRKPKGAAHINYCHTPSRFLWIDPEQALKEIWWPLHWFAKAYWYWLKKWDQSAVKNIDVIIANSREVQKRIKTIYYRDSEIIYPFVDVNFWKPTIPKQNYFLIAGRLQYAKGLEVVIAAFNQLGWPLHVVGTGRFENHLRAIAQPNVKFLGRLSDEDLRDQYSGALGYIYPQFEDFGMMPLEASSCGTASIGLAKGGSVETILPGRTGELLPVVTAQTLIEELNRWDHTKYDQLNLTRHAQNFSKEIFQQQLQTVMEKYL